MGHGLYLSQMKPPCVLRNIPKNPLFYKVLIMTSFQYDVTGDIIYIWALPLVPAKLGILNNQCEKMVPPPNPAYTSCYLTGYIYVYLT